MVTSNPYKEYLMERMGVECLETDGGFILYKITGEECRIVEIYVAPEKRLSGLGTEMTNAVSEIAKSRDCRFLTASTFNTEKGVEQAIMATLRYGFKIHAIIENEIRYYKEIK